ncbi:MAG: hypothetical protein Q7Q71_02075 [Verrucomicrobiota bacterium JB023]|nr:hypothetical protein [Verrucomicrobiota bacterium JB023]
MILRIECPSCQQAFEVSEELKGRTVECGACEHRFQVTDAVLAKRTQERYFPDEIKKNADLSRFGRAPVSSAPVEFRTAAYQDAPPPVHVGPVPLANHFAAGIGFLILVLTACFLFFGSGESLDAPLTDVEKPQRMILGGFLGVIGSGLLIWGLMRNRLLAVVISVLGLAGISALVWTTDVYRSPEYKGPFTEREVEPTREIERGAVPTSLYDIADDDLTFENVMEIIRWEASIQPDLVSMGESNLAVIWIRRMDEHLQMQLRNYFQQSLPLSERPVFNGRGPGGIFILKGQSLDLEEVATVASKVGDVIDIFAELRVVGVNLDGTVFNEADSDTMRKLEDPSEEAFYTLNFNELAHIDRERVRNAVGRLSRAEPVRMRSDITRRLVALLSENLDAEFSGDVAEALKVWSEPGDGADDFVVDQGNQLLLEGRDLPMGIVRFLSDRQTPTAMPLLISVWQKDPGKYQAYLEEFGSAIESFIWPYLESRELPILRSSVSILGAVGSKESVPYLQEASSKHEDADVKAGIDSALNRIMKR